MMDSNSLYITDEDGSEKRMTILFTFDSPDHQCQYVVFQDPELSEDEVFAMRYDEQGNLFPIEEEAEWEMVEEVIGAFSDEGEEGEEGDEE